MTQLQEYALIEDSQIIRTEWFKRPTLVPEGDWRVVGEVAPDFDPATHQLGSKTLQVLEDGTVAYVWSVVELPPPPVPDQIANWQARIILHRTGLFFQVDQAVKQSGNPEILAAWEYAPNVVRRSSFVQAIAQTMPMDDSTIDNLFVEGAKVK